MTEWRLSGRTQGTRRKTRPSATLSTKKSIWTALGATTNYISYEAVHGASGPDFKKVGKYLSGQIPIRRNFNIWGPIVSELVISRNKTEGRIYTNTFTLNYKWNMLRPTLNVMVLLPLKCLHSTGYCIGGRELRLWLNRLDKTQADSRYIRSR